MNIELNESFSNIESYGLIEVFLEYKDRKKYESLSGIDQKIFLSQKIENEQIVSFLRKCKTKGGQIYDSNRLNIQPLDTIKLDSIGYGVIKVNLTDKEKNIFDNSNNHDLKLLKMLIENLNNKTLLEYLIWFEKRFEIAGECVTADMSRVANLIVSKFDVRDFVDINFLDSIPNKSIKIKMTKSQVMIYDENEDNNAHSENVLYLAKLSKNKKMIEVAEYCLKQHLRDGSLIHDIKKIRDKIDSKFDIISHTNENQFLSYDDFVNESGFKPIHKERQKVFHNSDNESTNDFTFEDRKETGYKFCTYQLDDHSHIQIYLNQQKSHIGICYYSGENYNPKSKNHSNSRDYKISEIPKSYFQITKKLIQNFENYFKINLNNFDRNIEIYY